MKQQCSARFEVTKWMVRALDAERGLMKRVQKEEAWRDRALAAEQALKEALKGLESVATLVESFHQD